MRPIAFPQESGSYMRVVATLGTILGGMIASPVEALPGKASHVPVAERRPARSEIRIVRLAFLSTSGIRRTGGVEPTSPRGSRAFHERLFARCQVVLTKSTFLQA